MFIGMINPEDDDDDAWMGLLNTILRSFSWVRGGYCSSSIFIDVWG